MKAATAFPSTSTLNRGTCAVIAPPCLLALPEDLKVRGPHRICQLLSRVNAGPDLWQGNLTWETSVPFKWELTKTHKQDENIKLGETVGTWTFVSILSRLGCCSYYLCLDPDPNKPVLLSGAG